MSTAPQIPFIISLCAVCASHSFLTILVTLFSRFINKSAVSNISKLGNVCMFVCSQATWKRLHIIFSSFKSHIWIHFHSVCYGYFTFNDNANSTTSAVRLMIWGLDLTNCGRVRFSTPDHLRQTDCKSMRHNSFEL